MAKVNNKNYTSKDIKTLDGIEAVQLRPGMYIGSIDSQGLHHLLLEVVSNSIDEYLNGHGTKISVEISKDGKTATITDDGRGIPFGLTDGGTEAMIDIATSLHSGGKFGQEGYSVSGGLHGIGLTAVNALSTDFNIESVRDGEVAHLNSSRGRDTKFNKRKSTKADGKGTKIWFTPDPSIFGKSVFKVEKIQEMIKELSFLTAGLEFFVNGERYYSEFGLKDMIQDRLTNPITDPVYITGEVDGFLVEVAFQFEDRRSERVYAFTNNIPNREGGTHVTGFRSSFTIAMNRLARQYGFIEDKDSNLNGDMMRSGILAAVSIKMNKAPVFQGQTKERLMTAEARGAVSRVVTEHFENAISKKDVETIVKRALIEQRAEEAAKRSREAAKKMAAGGRDMKAIKDLPSKLTDSIGRKNAELWILEGDSAGGTAKICRNAQTQAILPLRGKVLNTHDRELAEIIENNEIKDIITALGTGVANQFNLNNLRYEKIIILADADSDGGHINVLLLTLFIKHLPQIIQNGKIYMALPPLYRVKSGNKAHYFYSDDELDNSKVKGDITRFKGIGEMGADELWDTTMNPETRELIQLTTDNFDESLEIFETLMGRSSAARRQFILENELPEEYGDFFGEEID